MRSRRVTRKSGAITLMVTSAILVLLGVGFIAMFSHARRAGEIEYSNSYDWAIDNLEGEDIYAYVVSGTSWVNAGMIGNRYDVYIINNSKKMLKDWNLYIDVPANSYIDGSWNGEWGMEEGKIKLGPSLGNDYLGFMRPSNFGFILYTDEAFEMNRLTLDYKFYKPVTAYVTFWILVTLTIVAFITIFVVHYVDFKLKKFAETHAAYKDLVTESLNTIANIIDIKDEYTKGHSVRVAIYSKMIAEKMGLSEYDQERIYYIGLLHDIGKIGVPQKILTKPGHLSDEEYDIIKKHPSYGSTIMKDFSSIPGVQDGIRYHHERFDGKGYNEGLVGTEIPLEGRIICVADSYDAMSSKRCYRDALSYDYILDELRKNAGGQFDPDILGHLIEIIKEGLAPISDAEMLEYCI